MTTVEVFAPAKVNLTLHITGRRPDGYHQLDSLVVFAGDIGDRLRFEPSARLSLTLSGAFTEGVPEDDSNLVLKAARMLQRLRGVTAGASIHLEKTLPNGGGIGGGSSDAAATLAALAKLWNVTPLSGPEALELGADLPVCMAAPTAQHMRGIGEVLAPVSGLPSMFLVLANPRDHVPTGLVFQHFRKQHGRSGPMTPLPSQPDFATFRDWLANQRNDLTESAITFAPSIQDAIGALRDAGATVANMSGSGSTCWGLYEMRDAAREAASALQRQHPDWWIGAAVS